MGLGHASCKKRADAASGTPNVMKHRNLLYEQMDGRTDRPEV